MSDDTMYQGVMTFREWVKRDGPFAQSNLWLGEHYIVMTYDSMVSAEQRITHTMFDDDWKTDRRDDYEKLTAIIGPNAIGDVWGWFPYVFGDDA